MASASTTPHVDWNTLRTDQAFTIVLTLLAFVIGDDIGRWVVLAVGIVMGLGAWSVELALFQQVHRRVLLPARILGTDLSVEDALPHRFALALGCVTLVLAFLALAAGATAVGWVLTLAVAVLALIKFSVRFCLGCFIYFQLDRRGLLPSPIAGAPRPE